MYRLRQWLKNNWPLLVLFFITFIFFWKFFLKNLVPISSDIITGTYFPWYDLRFSSFPSGIPVKNNILSDVVSIMYPWRKLAIDLMKQGLAPLWNPYILSGNVLLANFQSAPFYPLNIIYWIIPDFAKAWSLQIILQPLLAGLLMYLFLSNNKFSKFSSLFGSLVWAFSGFFIVWLEYNTIVQASLYFPLILYSIQKSFDNKRFYLLLVLTVSFSFYAGYPQVTLYELFFAGIFILVVLPALRLRNFFTFILYVILGVGLSMPFLLPGYEAATQSIRRVDNVANTSHVKFALPQQIITFIAPDYFGNPTSRNYWLIGGTYENAVIFVGGPAFMLFILSFFVNKKRQNRLLWYSWTISIIAALLIFKNPVSEFLGNSDLLFFSASVMGRFAMILTFGISVSSCFALEEILRRGYTFKSFLIPVTSMFLLLSIYASIAYSTHNIVSVRNLALPSLMFIVTAILILASIKIKFGKYIFLLMAVLIGVEMFDLYHFHDKYNSFSPEEFLYPKTPLTDYLSSQSQGRFESEGGAVLPPNMWMPYSLYSASGQDAVGSLRYNKFLEFINSGKLLASDRYAVITNYNSPLFDFLGISDVAAVKWKNGSPDFEGVAASEFEGGKFQKIFDAGRSIVLKNTKAYPRIFAVTNYVLASSDTEFATLLKSEDLSKTVILEEPPEKAFGNSVGTVKYIKFGTNFTSAEVVGLNNSMLVISQANFPGWKAYVDGVETHLYRANYDFMAILVPGGDHNVLIKYEPISFKLGLLGGGISLLFSILLYFYLKKPKKRMLK
jgi:hypothetical protein